MKKAETPSLTYSPRNAWDVYTTATQKRQMDALVKRYMDFLSNCKTERETVAYVQKRLQEVGFSEDFKKNTVFRNLRGKAIFAARKGKIPLQKGVHLIAAHAEAPHLRLLQKRLAEEVTVMVHSRDEYDKAVEASGILFGNSTSEALRRLDEDTLLAVFEGVPTFEVPMSLFDAGVKAIDLLVENAAVFPSKGEMRKLTQGGGVSVNKEKLAAPDQTLGKADLLDGKYLIVQRGKKNYYLIVAKQ